MNYIFNKPHQHRLTVAMSGGGDPFVSPLFRPLLISTDGTKFPNLRFEIWTNGILLTPLMWDKMSGIHQNLGVISVSVDAGCEEDYAKLRPGGNWSLLQKNLEFIGQKRQLKLFDFFSINMVVQRQNYRGICDFIRLGKKVGADSCQLSMLVNFGTWSTQQYEDRCVWNDSHPEHENFLKVMANPLLYDPIVGITNLAIVRQKASGAVTLSTG
ncbi:MAG: hypothetical protein HY537_10550 [Deltaproteobacteria bacterium]|nr:hypothetical protein [Deltaproteobacteria bacterium]